MEKVTKKTYGTLTYDKCKEIALNFKTKAELQKNNGSVYNKIRIKKWLELFNHMIEVQKPKGYWNYERCKEEALKYTRRVDLVKNNACVIKTIRENNWTELLDHMEYVCKPKGYWGYEYCKEVALKYTRRVDLQKKDCSIHHVIHKNGWLELLDHMEYVVRPAGYWDYERCKELMLKYDNWKDFISENYAAYSAISKKKWQKELGSHMTYFFKPNNHWTYDLCKVAASKYTSIFDIRNSEDSHAYIRIKKNGWDKLIEHFIEIKKPAGYWDYERCKEQSLKYKTRKDFATNSMVAYKTIRKNKWFNLLEHMPFQDNIKSRYIYVFEFENNTAYVGLTWNPEKRKKNHLTNTNSRIYKYLNEHDVKYEFKVISGKLTESEAQKEESKKITEYRDNGWVILNRATAGGLGSMRVKWSYKTIKKIIDTCTKISEVYEKIPSQGISIMRKQGFYDEMTKSLIYDIRPPNYWNDKERCRECASNFKYKSYFQKAYSGAYKACVKYGWLDEFFKNKNEQLFDNWNDKEKCHLLALTFNDKNIFRNRYRYVYNLCDKNGWLDEVISHMVKKKIELSYEICREESLKYTGRYNFQKGSVTAYGVSYRKGWLDDFYPKKI